MQQECHHARSHVARRGRRHEGTRAPAVITCLVFVLFSLGHDLAPPPWRGDPGTTFQEWRFDDADNPALPEESANDYGEPLAMIDLGLFGEGWQYQLPGLGTQTGYWDLGGEGGQITLAVPNPSWSLYGKNVWIQVTYYRDISQAPLAGVDVPEAVLLNEQTSVVENVPFGGRWMLHQSEWRIEPYPAQDSILVIADASWGSIVDQVVIDTRVEPVCNDPFADADGDGDVDQDDLGRWQRCFNLDGSEGLLPECRCFDRDNGGQGDGDVDMEDFEAFEACGTGPGIAADPDCDNN